MTYKLHAFFNDPPPQTRSCESPGCLEPGEYRAPKNARELNQYVWFCLEHVREYNASWDYYRGMNEREIEQHRQADVTWQRPTWAFGQRPLDPDGPPVYDPLGLFGQRQKRASPEHRIYMAPQSEEAEAVVLFEIALPMTQKTLKKRYIELVKRYHPDTNPNDPECEEHIKRINHAYDVLTKWLNKN